MYWFTETEMDGKPSGYQYLKDIEGMYPPLYELWHCPECHFTAHNRTFPDPLKHVYIAKTMARQCLAEAFRAGSGFAIARDALGAGIRPEDQNDFSQAIRLALLAIQFESVLADYLQQGYASLARSYLHLAWLYRDREALTSERSSRAQQLTTVLDAAAAGWPDIPHHEADAIREAFRYYAKALESPAMAHAPLEALAILLHCARMALQQDDTETAWERLDQCSRDAMHGQEETDQALRADDRTQKLSPEDRSRLLTEQRKFKQFLDQCNNLRETARKGLLASHRRHAETLVARNRSDSPRVLQQKLAKAGIPDAVIQAVLPPPRKSRLGNLFR